MRTWLENAIGYADRWLGFQMRLTRQPGCVFAVARRGRVVFENAYGHADLARGERLTPRHRFRIASHSKSFTAAAVMKLRENGRLRLDDPVGLHVEGLHPSVADVTVSQLLSHGAGLVRDGADAGQWIDERPFADEAELRAALAEAPVIAPESRMKYSNHGFGLLGLVIEAVTGQDYGAWIDGNIIAPSGLRETSPDAPYGKGVPVARGHTGEMPLGRRLVVPADNPTRALAPATGFISTAADLVRFFGGLDPEARRSVLSPASRRAMLRRQWSDPHAAAAGGYGLGVCLGGDAGWAWAGHSGAFQGVRTFTACIPGRDVSLSLLTNAEDGLADTWAEGVVHVLRTFSAEAKPGSRASSWTGRWWSLGGAVDLVPFGNRVLVAQPEKLAPFTAADEITVTQKDRGTVSLSGGYGIHGEAARLERGRNGEVNEVWFGGFRWVTERRYRAQLKRKYTG